MAISGTRTVVLAISALVAVAAAHAQSAPGMEGLPVGPTFGGGTVVYPYSDAGPPGAAFGDLLSYRHKRTHHESKDQICPGAQGDCPPIDLDVTFSGDTALGVDVIPDAFKVIAGIGEEELSCRKFSAVKAEVLAAADVPPNDLATAAAPPSGYERWTATLCGQQVAFLLGIWPATTAPSRFRIVYPFAP